jgi:hypothetical protein
MKILRKLLAGLLNLIVMSVLLLGSCVGPGLMYVQSPHWFLEPYNAEKSRSFFVAFRAKDAEGRDGLRVIFLQSDPARLGYTDIRYHLPEGRNSEDIVGGETQANIQVATEPGASQIVRVFVIGDTPWSSLSEYRVKDNRVEPLRHAHANGWMLLGILLCLVLVHYLMKPIRRSINRLVGLEPKAPRENKTPPRSPME